MLEVLPHGLPRRSFLGVSFHPLGMEEAVDLALLAMKHRMRLQHGDVNVAKLVQMQSDAELKRHTEESDIICPDGMGVVWGCRLLGIPTQGRVTGIDLMIRTIGLCQRYGFRPYLLGAKQDVLEKMAARLRADYPGLAFAGMRNGYFTRGEEDGIAAEIRESKADCLIVGITSPIKERFLNAYRDRLDVPLLIGVGGAFDVLSGVKKRAPRFVQRAGMEWLFRLAQEPRRLFRRYAVSNTKFCLLVARALFEHRIAGRDGKNA